MKSKKLLLLLIFTVTLIQCQIKKSQNEPDKKPNIVFILIDDFGWPGISCYGNKQVATPNIDMLAAAGMRFTDAYVMPQCTPTRAALMSGEHTARNRMWHVISRYGFPNARMKEPSYREDLPRETKTIAEALKENGYKTALLGKWHLNSWDSRHSNPDGYYTTLFQHAKGFYGFDYVDIAKNSNYHQRTDKGVDYLTDEAIGFIKNNLDNPFFIYLSHHTIHGPVLAPDDLVQKYLDKGFPKEGQFNATYLAAIEHMDNSVGRLLRSIDSLGVADNTVVFFYSDNGGVESEFSNAPLRAGKGSAYEGGIRVPFIVKWPGHIKNGKVSDLPVHITDMYPTLLDIAGVNKPQGKILDGISILPELIGRKMDRNRYLYFYMPLYDYQWGATPSAVIRSGDYKLIKSFGDYYDHHNDIYIPEGRLELFNLKEDIGEKNDLAPQMPEKVTELENKLMNWITNEMNATLPVLNPNYDRAKIFERSNNFNFSPVIERRIEDVIAKTGEEFRIVILKTDIEDYDGESLNLKFELADGTKLPDWFTFNQIDWTLFGTAPNPGTWKLKVTATDPKGEFVSQDFILNVN